LLAVHRIDDLAITIISQDELPSVLLLIILVVYSLPCLFASRRYDSHLGLIISLMLER